MTMTTTRPATAAVDASITPFLAPPTPDEETPAPRASDNGTAAMRRLRHPFAVDSEAKPQTAEH